MSEYEWLADLPIANKGYHTGDHILPENTIAAFQNAVKANFAIELDVRLTKDKRVVVFHDDNLRRMCGVDVKVSDLKFSELSKYKVLKSGHSIPLLVDVLKTINGKVPVLIDLKNYGSVGKLERGLLKDLQGYSGHVAVQSFNPFALRWFYNAAPLIARGQLLGNLKGKGLGLLSVLLLKSFGFLFFSKPHFIACEQSMLPYKRIERLRSLGFIILAWSIRNSAERERIAPYVDNVIFEHLN